MYPEVVGAHLHEVIATDSDVFLTAFGINAETEMGPWLRDTIVPSLILTGENDGGCNPRLNLKINAAMRSSELLILPEYKHSILIKARDIVAKNILRVLAKI